MNEAQAHVTLRLNSEHRTLMTANPGGPVSAGCTGPTSCEPLRNALAIAVTVPPRDIRLATVDTSAGIVTFDVVGGKTAHDEVAQAASTEHTENLCVHPAPLKKDATAR